MINFLFSFLIFIQSKNITVIDLDTKKPIPFVSFIGLVDHKGGYADENGVIVFDGNISQPFIISCIGYKTDTFNINFDVISLKPISVLLPAIKVTANKTDYKPIEIGYFKKNSWFSFASQAKYEFYTFIANPDTNITVYVKSLKIAVRGYRKKNFFSFKIRPHLKDVLNKKPNNELLITDITIDVFKRDNFVIIELAEPLILPKSGCFVGFETIGFSLKENEFIPFSDYSFNPNEENVLISIPLVKTNTKSLWRNKNGKGWFGSPSDTHNAFAFGLNVIY